MKYIVIFIITFSLSHSIDPLALVNVIPECNSWFKKYTKYLNVHNRTSSQIQYKYVSQLMPNCTSNEKIPVEDLRFLAMHNKILLSNDMDVRRVLKFFDLQSLPTEQDIALCDFNGLNVIPNSKSKDHGLFTLNFLNFKFNFYFHKTTRITRDFCRLNKNLFVNQSMFDWSKRCYFEKSYFSKEVCPYVFMNSRLVELLMSDITNSLIYKNQIEFVDINETANFSLNAHFLRGLVIKVAFVKIDHKLVNKHVFKNLQWLTVIGNMYDFQTDLFASFKSIKWIQFELDNYRIFFHRGLNWTNYLNTNVENISLDNSINWVSNHPTIYTVFVELDGPFKKVYEYPDTDICLFKDFPHQRRIFPVIRGLKPMHCTCTAIWLVQYSRFYLSNDYSQYIDGLYLNVEGFILKHCFSHDLIQNYTRACNFTQRFKNCFQNTIMPFKISDFFIENNFYFSFKWLQYILDVYLQTTFSLFGLCINIFTIIVINNKADNELKKSLRNVMYKHIRINSMFNSIDCVIRLSKLMTICIYPRTSFCSAIRKTQPILYFKIYVVIFLEGSIRLCAHVSFICFSISRYYLSTTNKSKYFTKFEKSNLFSLYLTFFICGLGFSWYKLFQYNTDIRHGFLYTIYPFDQYNSNSCDEILNPRSNAKCNLYNILNMANNILNSIVFFVVSLLADIGLLIFTQKTLERKKILFQNHNDSASLIQTIHLKEKVNKMIVVNGLLYFVSHAPEFLATTLLLVFSQKLIVVCDLKLSCSHIVEMTQVFGLCRICMQFFVLNYFDNNFRRSKENLLDRYFKISNKNQNNQM